MQQLKALQEEYNFKFHDSCRDFLANIAKLGDASSPAINADTDLIAWPGVSEPAVAMSEEELAEADTTGLYHDIAQLFHLQRMTSDFEAGKAKDGQLRFWHLKLLPHAYPIGKTYGGDPIVQVTIGKHAGKIFLTNHGSWYGFFEHLLSGDEDERAELEEEAEDAMDDLGLDSLASLDTDQLIDFMTHKSLDGCIWLADSYRDFYQNLCRYRGARLET